jgi:hypothetical protein
MKFHVVTFKLDSNRNHIHHTNRLFGNVNCFEFVQERVFQ